jgi:hypothetical protein
MPFVEKSHRKQPDPTIAGDRCFVEYKEIMSQWRKNPRWTTADQLLQGLIPDPFHRAYALAYAVFFVKHVMKYEKRKEKLNGGI